MTRSSPNPRTLSEVVFVGGVRTPFGRRRERVNRYGGAIALGHPLAASGVRLMNQRARQFEDDPPVRFGRTTMCIGLGMGGAIIRENPPHAR